MNKMNKMNKKQYQVPEVQVLELDGHFLLLAGSGEPGTGGTNIPGSGKARRYSWDEEDY